MFANRDPDTYQKTSKRKSKRLLRMLMTDHDYGDNYCGYGDYDDTRYSCFDSEYDDYHGGHVHDDDGDLRLRVRLRVLR